MLRQSHRFLTLIFCLLVWTAADAADNGKAPVNPLYVITATNDRATQSDEKERRWVVELASDDSSRQKGLMFRTKMPLDAGMLFRFDDSRPVAMWMKNTFIALDMIFLTDDGTIAHVHRNAEPHSLEIIHSRRPVRYVLELNAGEAQRANLQPGGRMAHPWFAARNK